MVYKSVKKQNLNEERRRERGKEACQRYRDRLVGEKKALYNEKARIRNQKRRDRLKIEAAAVTETRSKFDKKEERKRKQCLRMREWRDKMSAQKKEAIKRKDREYRQKQNEKEGQQKASTSGSKLTPSKRAARIEQMIEKASPRTATKLKDRKLFKKAQRTSIDTHVKATKQLFSACGTSRKKYAAIVRNYNINTSHHSKLSGIARNTFNYKSNGNLKHAVHQLKKNILEKFLQDISISTEYPNKKDVQGGKPQYILKRSLEETFELYNNRDDAMKMSFSSFAALRPKHVKLVQAARWRQCLCTSCENMNFLMVSLRVSMYKDGLHVPDAVLSTTKMVQASVCSTPSWGCYDRQCKSCDSSFLPSLLEEWMKLSPKVVTNHWERVPTNYQGREIKRLTKVRKELTRKAFVKMLQKMLLDFPRHHFVANHQWKAYTLALESLPDDSALCVLDFAENYTSAVQGEVQSAYYGRTSITLHPIVVHYKVGTKLIRDSVVFISDDLKHDWAAVKCFVQNLSYHLGIMAPHIRKLIMFSDGAASQYKSRLPFANISTGFDQPLKLEWNWFGSGHGKGPSDGESGVIKAYVTRFVKANEDRLIDSAQQFFQLCQEKLTNVDGDSRRHIYFVPVSQTSALRAGAVPNAKPLPGCRKIQTMRSNSKGVVRYRRLSCFCPPITGHISHLCGGQWKPVKLVEMNGKIICLVKSIRGLLLAYAISFTLPLPLCDASYLSLLLTCSYKPFVVLIDNYLGINF